MNKTEAVQFLNRLGYGDASGFIADFAFEFVKAKTPKATPVQAEKVHTVMSEFKSGKLHGGTGKKGKKQKEPVKKRSQAVAIALSEAGLSREK